MSARGKMVGAWGDFCIFRTPEGFFVRLEARAYSMRGGRPVCRRTYTTVNELPVDTHEKALGIIGEALDRKIELAMGSRETVQ